MNSSQKILSFLSFQLTAARRRLAAESRNATVAIRVSTHSRPKAAGFGGLGGYRIDIVSTHSRPKAAGICFTLCRAGCGLFQLTAARRRLGNEQQQYIVDRMFQLTAARRRLGLMPPPLQSGGLFQLTAARRRLVATDIVDAVEKLFQLTAARRRLVSVSRPPRRRPSFQLTAARRRLGGRATTG